MHNVIMNLLCTSNVNSIRCGYHRFLLGYVQLVKLPYCTLLIALYKIRLPVFSKLLRIHCERYFGIGILMTLNTTALLFIPGTPRRMSHVKQETFTIPDYMVLHFVVKRFMEGISCPRMYVYFYNVLFVLDLTSCG